jgi:arylsulfatase A-like enzyme
MASAERGQQRTRRNSASWAVGLFALAFLTRAAYVAFAGQSRFDPWRHLALVRSMRDGFFSLFADQPYLWYGPTWYGFAALWPEALRVEWLSAVLSSLSVVLVFFIAADAFRERARATRGALVTAGLTALCGPVIAYTCHPGPESLSLLLALVAVLLCSRSGAVWLAAAAGFAAGLAVVLRTPFAFLFPMVLPQLAVPSRLSAFAVGGSLPLLATGLRNHAIIRAHPFVFTWDGLATPSDGFGWLSTLVPQLHPDIATALRRLHERTMPDPEWIWRGDEPAWGLLTIVVGGVIALGVSRRWIWIFSVGVALGWFAMFDETLTSNFFRIHLPLLIVYFLAVGWLAAGGGGTGRVGLALAVAMLVGGIGLYRSPGMPALEAVTPPENLLREDAYMVNSGYFHPAGLVYRFPDKRFIGMPLDPKRFDAFRAAFPQYRSILWHGFSVQTELGAHLKASGRFPVAERARNAAGHRYAVLREVAKDDRPPIVLITLDTTRPDHLSVYGYAQPTSPNLDVLGRDGFVFQDVVTTSSWTLPTHASLFTGLFPSTHGAHYSDGGMPALDAAQANIFDWFRAAGLPEQAQTLAETLRRAGYRTFGAAAGPWLKPIFGLDQGFEQYWADSDDPVGRRAPEITAHGLKALEAAGSDPFLLFLNYFDPHDPYDDVDADAARFRVSQAGSRAEVLARYDAEIAYMDRHIGVLFDALRERGLYERSWIVVTSDHGEHFGEHGLEQHGFSLYQDVVSGVLIVKPPSASAWRPDTRQRVQSVDVMPTLLKALELDAGLAMEGNPIGALDHPVVAELFESPGNVRWKGPRFARQLTAVYSGRHKLIVSSKPGDRDAGLFDLAADPGENVDLRAAQPELLRELQGELARWRSQLRPVLEPALPRPLDTKTREQLQALGYLPEEQPEAVPRPDSSE